ncbi:hypothetical protein IFE09_11305 [Streptomyces microflavus]|uniref:hypothetical protein n=1 Tax=Streptomyces microflavus TaxID=1919 RepID=UPI00192B9EB6|nr:hypothetical protein [Streptomyces microflavus]QQZ54144.1 hypothetical protein IFE09_11305 [Streptomyces microflavus]
MATGKTTATVQCPECTETITIPVCLTHPHGNGPTMAIDLRPVQDHTNTHVATYSTKLPTTAQQPGRAAERATTRHTMPMATFEGPATVLANGVEYEVEASLSSSTEEVRVPGGGHLRGLTEWRGTLQTRTSDDAWNIYQADQPTLRADGRDGAFICTGTQAESTSIDINGSGPAPFGD